LKISFLSAFPPYRGGISRHSSQIYKYLIKRYQVQAINFKKLYPNFLFPGKSQYSLDLGDAIGARVLSSINIWSWRKTLNVIYDYKPDIIIFKFWHPFFCPCYKYIIKRVRNRLDCPVIMVCDNIYPHEWFPLSSFMINGLVSHVDAFIIQSSAVEKELLGLLDKPIYNKVFHPIYNDYPKSIDAQVAKKKIGILEGFKVVLFFGIIRNYKGLDLLIKSMEKVFLKDNNIMLVIAGECYSDKDKYVALIQKSNYKNRILWIEEFIKEEEVSVYFSAADVVVLPYRSASQSGVIPLSYNYNKPVIVPDLDGLVEVVEDNKTGLIYSLNDVDDLTLKILDFFKNYNAKFYKQNIIQYKKNFSWENFSNSIQNLYNLIVERRKNKNINS
tara:strand:+ start:178 stop:1335 length:1158 start_codon:yes stop_codon:yes gene_type:complete